jgi:hypothetical protein
MADSFNFFSTAADILNVDRAKGSQSITLGNDFAGINARGDALQNWCWYCVPPAIYNTDAINLDALTVSSLAAPLVWLPWYYVQAATLPDRDIQTRTIIRNGHAMHFPQSYSVGDLTLTLFLDSKNVARQWLRSWQHLVVSVDNPRNATNQGRFGLPYQYKRDISFVVHSVRKKRVLHYKYIGCWPKSTSGLELTSGESQALTCDVTFAVEDVRVSVGNEDMIESLWIPNDL